VSEKAASVDDDDDFIEEAVEEDEDEDIDEEDDDDDEGGFGARGKGRGKAARGRGKGEGARSCMKTCLRSRCVCRQAPGLNVGLMMYPFCVCFCVFCSRQGAGARAG
jgi:hypothetical protein